MSALMAPGPPCSTAASIVSRPGYKNSTRSSVIRVLPLSDTTRNRSPDLSTSFSASKSSLSKYQRTGPTLHFWNSCRSVRKTWVQNPTTNTAPTAEPKCRRLRWGRECFAQHPRRVLDGELRKHVEPDSDRGNDEENREEISPALGAVDHDRR